MWLWPLWCAFLWHVAGHQGIPQDELGGIGGDGWVELPKVVDPTCSCQPSSSASDGELLQLSQWNCLRIHQAGVDYATLAANYGQNVNQDWKERLQAATAMCDQAKKETDLKAAAQSACCAWGDVLMQQRECCNVPGPPYCTNPTDSKLGHASALVLALLLALLAAGLPKCGASFFAPSLMLAKASAPVEEDEAQEVYRAKAALQVSELAQELEATWERSSLRNLKQAKEWKAHSAHCFAAMQVAFDFQKDSVKNQYEHFISLLRSHVSVVCDREKRRQPQICEETALLAHALKELHDDILASCLPWQQQFLSVSQEAELGASQRHQWCSIKDAGARYPAAFRELEELVLFLLIWGEAGNLRNMPEMLYFIYHVMLEADSSCHFQAGAVVSALRASGSLHGSSHAFLVDIVRPIYRVIFDEHYVAVKVKPDGKDDKKLRPTYDRYLPPDSANYDDWNELFQDIPRLLGKVAELMRQSRTRRYYFLRQLPWRKILKDAKTHRELHSWWGVWAGTHRIWFLHSLLFFLSMFWVSSRSFQSNASGWSVFLGGNSPLVCLSFVGLLVPAHLFLWKLGTWFTTGIALRRGRALGVILFILQVLCGCIPVVTFLLVRYLDAVDSPELSVALWIHAFVCCLGALVILLQPCENGDKLRHATGSSWTAKLLRWLFWVAVLAVKWLVGLGSIAATQQAITDLRTSQPGREALNELPQVAFGPNWDKDMVEWLAIWGTGFICYVADTQYWFVLGCGLLGFVLSVYQRGWRLYTLVSEDAICGVPQRFAERVILAAPRGNQNFASQAQGPVPVPSARRQWWVKWFPDLWDRIVDFMHCEDKLDDFIIGQMKFSPDARNRVSMEMLCHEPIEAKSRFLPPAIFTHSSCVQRSMRRDLGILPDETWPWNVEVQWRLNAFARNLASEDLPRPFLTPYVPGLTVLIPHYGEQILLRRRDLEIAVANAGEEVPLIAWLEKRYHGDFTAFTSRMTRLHERWPRAGSRWDQYQDNHWEEICMWASMRSQTLWRTVEGLMLYQPALDCFNQMVERENQRSLLLWDSYEVFTCMVSMQMYAFFDDDQYRHTEKLLERFQRPDRAGQTPWQSFQIAFIDFKEKGENANADGIHAAQERRYFSCLIDPGCAREGLRRKPRLTVELPGFPILGDGKGDNQNHAIIFSRGSIIQCIDANQGGYFEQMLLLPCALGEFRQEGPGLNPRIVGFAEHITSDIGSLGDFAAGAETAFGTVLQRCYSFLGGRMHYGHPDMMNKEFMIQQGGVSKATKTVNLSEDIFAGMDFTLRGNGRNIVHREYLHVAKGRDLGFNTILTFFSKLSAGTGEQLLTRQVLRLGHELDLPEFLTFYYAHAGFYLTQFFLSKSIPLLVFIWLVVVLDDPEQNFPAMDPDSKGISGATVIATMLITQFSKLLLLFIVAQLAPLFMQVWLESSIVSAFLRVIKQIFTLAPLHFVFQAKVIGNYIINEVTLGGAKYLPTGRGLPTTRRAFLRRLDKGGGLYNDYAVLALYDGAQLLLAVLLVILGGGLAVQLSLFWWLLALGLTICSWLLAPFIFNPYQFAHTHFRADLGDWKEFFFDGKGRYWVEWYTKTRLLPGAGLRSSGVEIIKRGLFLGAWYTILNQKVHMLTVIFSGSSRLIFSIGLVAMPPIGMSLVACCILPALPSLWGQPGEPLALGWSALTVVLLDCLETILYLWKLICVKWWKSFAVGLLLKFCLLSFCLEICECAFRLHGGSPPAWLRVRINMWLHGHRMAQDIFVSSLILALLSVGAMCCGCDFCGLHNILVYRDPGGVHKNQQAQAVPQRGEGRDGFSTFTDLSPGYSTATPRRAVEADEPPEESELQMAREIEAGAPPSFSTTTPRRVVEADEPPEESEPRVGGAPPEEP